MKIISSNLLTTMNSLSSKQKPISHFLLSLSSSSKFTLFSLFSTSSSSSFSRRFEEESRNVKVSVWWDIENCSIPSSINAYKIAHLITSAVRVNGIKGPLHIYAFGDILHVSKPNQEALSSTGINLIHVPHGGKNSADRSLLIDLMYWVSQNPPPAHIFLISNDRDFANILYRLRMNNYNVLLAAKDGNHIGVLGGAASIMWHWSELVKGENLSGRHFNQPPDGPFNSWYGHYKGPLEDPFDLPEQRNSSKAKNDSSSNASDLSSDKVQPIPKSVLNQIRHIIHSYPYGLSITELRAQMAKNNVTLDKNFYGHKRFSHFLLSMPQILKIVNAADGQFFIRPVSPKVPVPVESDDHSIRPTSADGSSDSKRREVKGKDHSITRMIDVEQRLPLSSVNVKKENTVETRVEKISEKKALDVPMDDQVISTEERYAGKTVNPAAPSKEQDLKYEMGLFRRLWYKWFTGSKKVEMTTPDITDKSTTANVIHEKSPTQEDFTKSTRQREACGTSYPSSTVNASSDIDGKSDVGRGVFARVLSWFVSSKDQTSVSTPTSQFTKGSDLIENLRKHEDASHESKHKDVLHSRKQELFSKKTFWNSFESFLRTQRGFNIVSNSASREELAKKLGNDGPLVLRPLPESDLGQLIDSLVSEKKWITEFPSKTPRFKFSRSPGKSPTPIQIPISNGLSSLFLSSSPENPQMGISSILPKKSSEKSRSEVLSDCQKLIQELLKHHPEGFNMGSFKRQFSEKYGYHLDHQKLGYSKLVSLIQVRPGVKIESCHIYPDNAVYAPGIKSLDLKDKLSGSDSEMTDLPPKNEAQCPWEELGPVDDSNLTRVNKEYEPSLSEDEFSEEERDVSLTATKVREQSRSPANGEDSSLVQILNSWYSSKNEGDTNDHDSVSNENALVEGSKEETGSFGSSPAVFKSKPRAPKSYTFVEESMEDNKDKLIDGMLDNLKKADDSRMES